MSASSSTMQCESKEMVDQVEEVHHHNMERQWTPYRNADRFDVNLSRWRDERSCFARAPEPEFFCASNQLNRCGAGGYTSGAKFMSANIGYVQDRGGLHHASEGRF